MQAERKAGPWTRGLSATLAACALGACTLPNPADTPTDAQLRAALAESLVESSEAPPPGFAPNIAAPEEHALQSLYEARNFDPIWVGPDGANERGRQLLARLSDAEIDALNPDRYGLTEIIQPLASGDAGRLASAELYFSRALMRYAADLRGIGSDDVTVVAAAGATLDLGGYLDSLIPRDPAYRRLRAAMRLYRGIAAAGGWEPVPDGPTLRRGVNDPRIVLLRRRLGATGDLPAAEARANSDIFDEAVAAALKRFQARHGLAADGIAGSRTLEDLNIPVEDRIEQIAAGLEARRHNARYIGENALVVNIAAQELVLIDGGKEILTSRTIVGRVGWETPLLSSEIRSIEVNPAWAVPPRIAVEEILPQVRRHGPDYLRTRGYRVFDAAMRPLDATKIDWDEIDDDTMPYYLRQDAGPGNALGRVKFLFPNDDDVYLHDTPGRALFERTDRALSHGCVRVEKAHALAVRLLRMGAGWRRADYERALARGETIRIRLDRPVPVYLVSIPVWVEEDGTIQFRADPHAKSAPETIDGGSSHTA